MKKTKKIVKKIWRRIRRWQPIYWFRCHTFTRYHMIDVSGQDGYRWGWVDKDYLMLLACMKLLVDFVEKETFSNWVATYHEDALAYERKDHPFEDDGCCGLDARGWWEANRDEFRDLREIYDWWKTGRARERAAIDDVLDRIDGEYEGPLWEEWKRLKDEAEKKEDRMLGRLVVLRGHLWT